MISVGADKVVPNPDVVFSPEQSSEGEVVIKEEQPEDLSIVSGSNVHSNWSPEFLFFIFWSSMVVYWWFLVVMVLRQKTSQVQTSIGQWYFHNFLHFV